MRKNNRRIGGNTERRIMRGKNKKAREKDKAEN
jgi:hypothetical protein